MNKRLGLLSHATLASSLFIAGIASGAATDISLRTPPSVDMATSFPVTFSGAGNITGIGNAFTATSVAGDITVNVANTTAAKEISVSTGSVFSIPAGYNQVAGTISITVAKDAVVESTGNVWDFSASNASTGTMSVINSGTMTSTLTNGLSINAGAARSNAFNLTNNSDGTINAIAVGQAGFISSLNAGSNANVNFLNAGTINADRGIDINDSATANNPVNITNSGTINSYNQEALRYNSHAAAASQLANSGTLKSFMGNAVLIASAINGTGQLSNSGTITAMQPNTAGVVINQALPLLNNTGTIQSLGSTGFSFAVQTNNAAGVLTLLNNSSTGVIKSTGGMAIKSTLGAIANIVNAGTISRGSDIAWPSIDLSSQTVAATITQNAGTITGDIRLSNQNEPGAFILTGGTVVGNIENTTANAGNKTIFLNGGTLTGNINLTAAQAHVVNVNGTFTTGGTISNAQTINVANPGTVFTVANNVTGLNTLLNVVSGSSMVIKNGVVLSPTTNLNAITNTGLIKFEVGRGVDTSSNAITNNSTGQINAGVLGTLLDLSSGQYGVKQAGSSGGYIGNLSRFYVLRSFGGVINHTLANLDTSEATTALLSFVPKADDSNLYFEAQRIPASQVDFGRIDGLTERVSRRVLASVETVGALNNTTNMSVLHPAFGALQAIVNGVDLARESERLAPTVNGGTTRSVVISHQGLLGNTVLQRLASLRDARQETYVAGSQGVEQGLWGQAVANRTYQHSRDGLSGYTSRGQGIAFGLDRLFDVHKVAGLAVGHTHTFVKNNQTNANTTKILSWNGLVYGSFDISERWHLDASMNYAKLEFTGVRNISLPGSVTTAFGNYYGKQYGAGVMAGYDWKPYRAGRMTTLMGARIANLRIDPYIETGASNGLNLSVENRDTPERVLTLGGRFKMRRTLNRLAIVPEVHGLLNYDASARAPLAGAEFVVNGAPVGGKFFAEGFSGPRVSWNVGTSLALKSRNHWHVKAQYDYMGKRQLESHSGMMTLRFVW